MPTLYISITNHGFGHVTRTASVLAELQHRSPDTKLIIATTAPRWLLEEYLEGNFIYHPRVFDVGVIQIDSLQVDREATFAAWQQIRDQQADLIAAEVKFLQANQVDLIFGDIPPMIGEIAKVAKIPCWMAGNFGWDFIYRDWGGKFIALADWLAESYSHCDRLFRLPFAEPMHCFPHRQDVGLTGAKPKYAPEYLREKFNLDSDRPTTLLTFGGLSLQSIPYQNLANFPDWQFITFDRNAPDLPNLTKANGDRLRPVDLMVICDRLVTKPGYGTLAEALRVGIPVVCLTREGFLEAENLISGVKNYAQHLIISPQEFYEGDWSFLSGSFQDPAAAQQLEMHGETTITQAIWDYLH
ncbi:glycosyl transferase [Pseudanabaena sp. 'Roaring Creek']|uniref:glycosyl transferase n=1 Tax=Pseudanabaena sp. 'Roaring Creek' TaxID=1681830 RepID=UPI0006D7ED2F|nr:glycosyl transferase [Pseudanabaena sp. 'Roaring Creek']